MSYVYRRLTPEERVEVERQRRENGYPLHSPPHPYRDQGYYAISAANFEHVPVMANPTRCTHFETILISSLHAINADIIAWVVLPNHYHLLVGVHALDNFATIIQRIHGRTSHDWNQEDGLIGRRVWYRYYDRYIRNEHHFYRAMNYIHFNPVKHQYVSDPYEWPWTSLRGYLEDQGREWLREKWKEHPIDPAMSGEFQE